MNYKAKIYVTLKKSILDPQGRTVERSLHNAGFSSVQNVRVGKFIELELSGESFEVKTQLEAMTRDILSNPIMESVRFELEEAVMSSEF
ncbi:MAG: phosphoribosylformylglycinamidine synthase subunit PurS [Pseudopedobacter sp.]|nr:phosphoribosylformylglycinamidine synthase subunit PurS [Deinococcales bacterium]